MSTPNDWAHELAKHMPGESGWPTHCKRVIEAAQRDAVESFAREVKEVLGVYVTCDPGCGDPSCEATQHAIEFVEAIAKEGER